MPKADRVFLGHMLAAIDRLAEFMDRIDRASFDDDWVLQNAVIRELETVRHLSAGGCGSRIPKSLGVTASRARGSEILEGGESSTALSELRRDLEHVSRFRIRFGGVLLVASGVMALAGWQAIGLFGMPVGILFGTLPTAALGAGVILREVVRSRGERRRIDRADEAEEAAIRFALQAERSRQRGVNPTPGDT